jgi:hypothetical protein
MSSSTVETSKAIARNVTVRNETLSVELVDGRLISVPLSWFPRLVHATRKERNTWRLIAGGRGIHWPDVDEDISVANLLDGHPSGESQTSFKKWLSERAKKSPRRLR